MPATTSSAVSENAARISALDDARLARWPVPYESFTVPTRYGSTHIIASGRPDAPPLVLIHALGVTSTMWLPNVAALSRDYRTYALDTIGDVGRSTLKQPDLYPRNGQACSQWLVDVFNEIGIGQADVIGASMGGWITMNHAIHAAERVRRIVLLGPMGLPSWLTTLKVLSHLWSVLLFPTRSNLNRIIRWALGDAPSVSEAFAGYLSIGASSRSRRLAPPLNLSDDQLRKIKPATLLMLGARDNVIGNANEAARRARRQIPHVEVEIIPGAGHMMNTERPELVNARILGFLPG
ncbi:MAG TPA: alpha/beta fold hydrolase [Anaerolineales bacterium]|nr:alpha/beta fold hydrolase [Anaerolineales bacterium]